MHLFHWPLLDGPLYCPCLRYILVSNFFADVCYLRLDFLTFSILGLADSSEVMGGMCLDSLKVTVSQLTVYQRTNTQYLYQRTQRTYTKNHPTFNLIFKKTFFIFQSTSNDIIPEICGQNSGQHSEEKSFQNVAESQCLILTLNAVYVDMDQGCSGNVKMDFSFTGTSSIRVFEIKATQVECGSRSA